MVNQRMRDLIWLIDNVKKCDEKDEKTWLKKIENWKRVNSDYKIVDRVDNDIQRILDKKKVTKAS